MKIQDIARICHETNRAYCITIGDYTQPRWEDASESQIISMINGVNFHIANPDSSPARSHEEWLREKKATGWKYGPIKDTDKKEHPCFKPYEELPEQERIKDMLFVGIVNMLRPYVNR